MIVPFPPSAGLDVIARIVAFSLAERIGQNVIVDNRAGAGGTIGTETACARRTRRLHVARDLYEPRCQCESLSESRLRHGA